MILRIGSGMAGFLSFVMDAPCGGVLSGAQFRDAIATPDCIIPVVPALAAVDAGAPARPRVRLVGAAAAAAGAGT
jgi:hypothetical protein